MLSHCRVYRVPTASGAERSASERSASEQAVNSRAAVGMIAVLMMVFFIVFDYLLTFRSGFWHVYLVSERIDFITCSAWEH